MKDIFSFIINPSSENREKIFGKNNEEKKSLTIKIFLFGFIFFEIFINLFIYKFGIELNTILIGIFSFGIYYILGLLIVSLFLHLILKIFGNKRSFIDTFFVVLIPSTFTFTIYGIIYGIINLVLFLGIVDLLSLVTILGIIVIIWSLWLFLVLLNGVLLHKGKTIGILIILALIFKIYTNNIYDGYEAKTRDIARETKINSLKTEVEIYFYENDKLPEKINDFLKSQFTIEEVKDLREGEFSKLGCEFTFKYEKISEEKYKLSYCPESEENILKAKNDNGNDEKRVEYIEKK